MGWDLQTLLSSRRVIASYCTVIHLSFCLLSVFVSFFFLFLEARLFENPRFLVTGRCWLKGRTSARDKIMVIGQKRRVYTTQKYWRHDVEDTVMIIEVFLTEAKNIA